PPAGLPPPRLAGGAGRLDRGEVARLDESRRRRGALLLARSPPRQRHALLGQRDRQRRQPLVLRARARAPLDHGAHRRAHRRGTLHGGGAADPTRTGGAGLRRHPPLDGVRPWRPLHGRGGACAARRRAAGVLPGFPELVWPERAPDMTRAAVSVVVTDMDNTLFDLLAMWHAPFGAMLERRACATASAPATR